jgi:hypothetical protein
MNPVVTQLDLDARTSVDVAVFLVDLLNQGRYAGIFSLMSTRLAVFPGIIAALGDIERFTE